jgi:hypothetical protein
MVMPGPVRWLNRQPTSFRFDGATELVDLEWIHAERRGDRPHDLQPRVLVMSGLDADDGADRNPGRACEIALTKKAVFAMCGEWSQ